MEGQDVGKGFFAVIFLCVAGVSLNAWLRPSSSALPLSINPTVSVSAELSDAADPHGIPAGVEQATVYVVLSPDCPISNAMVPELKRLAERHANHGIQFWGILPGELCDAAQAASFQGTFNFNFPMIIDHDGRLIDRLKATHTPQAIVQVNGRTIYSGRINDRFVDIGKAKREARQNDLADVLTAVSEHSEISVPSTEPIGCPIPRRRIKGDSSLQLSESARNSLTFNRHIAPIIFEHCSQCHRPCEAAPFTLLSYDDVRKHSAQILIALERGLMPPWKAEEGFGSFANVHRLSDEQLRRLREWIESDQVEGDPEELPLTPLFPEGWQLGRPDLELMMPEPFSVLADGPDIYQHFVIPTGLTSDRLISAVEFRPGAPEVVHHSIIYFDTTGRGRELDAEDPQPGYSRIGSPGFAVSGSLGGWGPGGQPRRLPEGMGRLLQKHSDLVVQIHYHPAGRAMTDRSRIGLYFAPESAKHLVTEIMVANVDLNIPAGESRFHHHAEYQVPVDTILFDATPHMHVLGKEIKAVAHRPDGTTEPLIWIRNWDFYWQTNYVYTKPVRLPAGTRIELDCWFDNSDKNPLNPSDPPQAVFWGDYSTDEMAICYFQATTDTWDDYVELNKHSTDYFAKLWNRYQQTRANDHDDATPK